MGKHILVISQYFFPEQFRINDICTEWVKRGYKVTVITGIPNYPEGKYYKGYGLFKKRKETYNGVDIIRIPLIPRGKSKIMLGLNYLSFVISGFFWKTFTRIKADLVFIFEVSPMTQALPGVWYAKRRKIPCYIYVQDLWPENVEIVAGIKNKFILKRIGKMVDRIYRCCTKIFATSNSFVNAIAARGVPLEKIECWPQFAEDFYQPQKDASVPEIPSDGVFNIIFAGNIGYAQGLDILPKTAEILRKQSEAQVRFIIVGDGRYKDEFMKSIGLRQINDWFLFIPRQEAIRIPEFLSACDAAFLCLTENPLFAMTIPAKLQSYMACGLPIIAAAAGETKRLIDDAQVGLCSKPGDASKLADHILQMSAISKDDLKQLGTNGIKYNDAFFSKEKLLDTMDMYLNLLDKHNK